MKKILILCAGLLLSAVVFAQSPAAFKYQAIARNASGDVLVNQRVSFRISILEGDIAGAEVFKEIHSASTNEFGLVNLEIGNGSNILGNIAAIHWGGNAYFLKTEMDPLGGSSYLPMGISQLLSVPYALHAKTVENDRVDDADADPGNEIQELQLVGKELSLTKIGGKVTLPITDSWLTHGSDIYFKEGKVGIGKIPGSDLRQFQSVTNDLQAVAGVNNSALYAAVFGENLGMGPAADFRNRIRIMDGTQGPGKVLTSDVNGFTSWQAPVASPWIKEENNLYYSAGWIGIGTAEISYPLSLRNSSNTCYMKLLDNQGADGMRIGAYLGHLALFNDNVDKNMMFKVRNASGYQTSITISGATGNVGIGDASPDATLDVEGTVKIGSAGVVLSEIREVTGTTGSTGTSTYFDYPSGYNMGNTRVLSVEVNGSSAYWFSMGMTISTSDVNIGCNLSPTHIYVYYPDHAAFHGRAFRILLMKVQ